MNFENNISLLDQDTDEGRRERVSAGESGAGATALESVMGVLLLHPQPQLRAHGATILQEFISKQVRRLTSTSWLRRNISHFLADPIAAYLTRSVAHGLRRHGQAGAIRL